MYTGHRCTLSLGLAIALCFVAAETAVAASRTPSAPSPRPYAAYVPGQLLIEFRAGVPVRDLRSVVRGAGAEIVRTLPAVRTGGGRRLVLVQSRTLGTRTLAAALSGSPLVARTSPNYYRRLHAAPPDDPGLVAQWGLAAVHAPQAWETSVGSPTVVVASIDTGVDFLHPDLAANMWQNPAEIPANGIDDDANGYVDDVFGIDAVTHDSCPMDDYGHGTHTSGIMAAVSDNGAGIAGAGWTTRIMALKSIDIDGWGSDAAAIECIDYVVHEKVDHGVNVVAINASWGGPGRNALLRDAIQRAGDAGIVFCASAGNDSKDLDRRPDYPCCFTCGNIISVAATNERDGLAGFSNWGAGRVDLGAPGVDVLSTLPRFLPDSSADIWGYEADESMYGSWSGTSMATPFVAGTVAVCAAAYPAETMDQRIARILSSADRLRSLRGRCVTGGRLDMSGALGEGSPAGDVVPPHTTVVGNDGLWHDVPVELRLWASDGLGGSGVARTRWRLDGGAWQRGTSVLVPEWPAAQVVCTVEYRSTDRAGNVEAMQSCDVKLDTTGPADGEIPGVPLPASPATGDVAWPGDTDDVFQVALIQGESLRVAASGVPGTSPALRLYPPSSLVLEGSPPVATSVTDAAGSSLVCCAEASGTYYVDVHAGRGVSGRYRLTWTVVPVGIDVTPPWVTVVGQDIEDGNDWGHTWFNRPVTLTLVAGDDPLGTGIGVIEASMDDGVTWSAGQHPLVAAPPDHSNDGLHIVHYRATDLAGNTSPESVCLVAIDTAGPVTEAWGPKQAVRRGGWAPVRIELTDLSWEVKAQLVVRSLATGNVVKTKNIGWWWTGEPDSINLRCDLPRGRYEVLLAGTTHDEAGNLWQSAVCRRALRVR